MPLLVILSLTALSYKGVSSMYLHEQLEPLEALRRQQTGMLPCTFDPDLLSSAKKVEVWATGFKDDGPDYTEVRVLDAKGLIHKCIIGGY